MNHRDRENITYIQPAQRQQHQEQQQQRIYAIRKPHGRIKVEIVRVGFVPFSLIVQARTLSFRGGSFYNVGQRVYSYTFFSSRNTIRLEE